jgi:hypothetical protein
VPLIAPIVTLALTTLPLLKPLASVVLMVSIKVALVRLLVLIAVRVQSQPKKVL